MDQDELASIFLFEVLKQLVELAYTKLSKPGKSSRTRCGGDRDQITSRYSAIMDQVGWCPGSRSSPENGRCKTHMPDDRTPKMLFEQAVCKENVKYILNHLQYPIGYPHLIAAPSSSLL
jgi:hypothetical protein